MNIEAVRLLELRMKGDRLDEINAEEMLERRATAQARAQARRRFVRRLRSQLVAWLAQRHPARVTPSSTLSN